MYEGKNGCLVKNFEASKDVEQPLHGRKNLVPNSEGDAYRRKDEPKMNTRRRPRWTVRSLHVSPRIVGVHPIPSPVRGRVARALHLDATKKGIGIKDIGSCEARLVAERGAVWMQMESRSGARIGVSMTAGGDAISGVRGTL